ncbi:MAG: histidine phosphatase family protein [Corynebacterium sp.]|nr:histidine phosphatase family protein [Corynebacterium sp.]
MALIYLVRHGQAGAGMSGYGGAGDERSVESRYDGLTDLGRRQAATVGEALARRLDGGPRLPVICGPLHRQHDTAAAVARALDGTEPAAEPVTDTAWKELDSDSVVVPWLRRNPETAARLKAATGHDEDAPDAAPVMREVLAGAIGEWVGGESFRQFRATVLSGLTRAAASARQDGGAVVATSAGVIATCTAAVSGLSRQVVPPLMGRVYNASVTVIKVTDEPRDPRAGYVGAELVSFNEYAHLDRTDATGARPELTLL